MQGDWADYQAQFSVAYVKAVAAVAGFYAEEGTRSQDKDGVDLSIRKRGPMGTSMMSPQLDVQVKSHLGPAPKADPWKYDLKATSYRTLRATIYQSPRILVVVMMPKDLKEWLKHTHHTELTLRRCAYWRCLVGEPDKPNTASVRVKMPLTQILDSEAVATMMANVAKKNSPV